MRRDQRDRNLVRYRPFDVPRRRLIRVLQYPIRTRDQLLDARPVRVHVVIPRLRHVIIRRPAHSEQLVQLTGDDRVIFIRIYKKTIT